MCFRAFHLENKANIMIRHGKKTFLGFGKNRIRRPYNEKCTIGKKRIRYHFRHLFAIYMHRITSWLSDIDTRIPGEHLYSSKPCKYQDMNKIGSDFHREKNEYINK